MNRVATNLEQGRVLSKALIITLIVVVLGGLAWFLFGRGDTGSSATARKTADTFVNAIADKNTETSYEMLSDAIKQDTSKESWQAWLEFAFADVEGNPTFVEELPVQEAAITYGEGASVSRYVYSFKVGGETYEAPFVVVNKDGSWKIYEIGTFE